MVGIRGEEHGRNVNRKATGNGKIRDALSEVNR
jgi:hypothetical protein